MESRENYWTGLGFPAWEKAESCGGWNVLRVDKGTEWDTAGVSAWTSNVYMLHKRFAGGHSIA